MLSTKTNSMTVVTSLFDEMAGSPPWYSDTPRKTTVPISVDFDTLALSVHQYKKYANDPHCSPLDRYVDFSRLSKYVVTLEEDFTEANKIALYYGKRYLASQLKYTKVSPFQSKVLSYLTSDRKTYNENQIGMIYRIPEFYYADVKVDDIFSKHFPQQVDLTPGKRTLVLTPLDKIKVKSRSDGDCMTYWLKEKSTNAPVRLDVDFKNQLRHLWDKLFDNKNDLEVNGSFSVRKSFNGESFYFGRSSWTVV